VNDGTATTPENSNEVVSRVSGPGQKIKFTSVPDGPPITSTPFDQNLYVNVGAARCNVSNDIDEVLITVTTQSLNDREVLSARETGPNTGIFETTALGVIRSNSATPLNNVLEGLPGDNAGAVATAQCLGETLSTSVSIQPGGFVFDSVTNAPVPGSRVVVMSLATQTFAAALRLSDSETTDEDMSIVDVSSSNSPEAGIAIAEVMTDADGYFDLGDIPQGSYRIEVFPPFEYQYPSVRQAFPGFDRQVDQAVSYGLDFTFDGGVISEIDIPLDPAVGIPLTIGKTADRESVRRGGFVVYTLTARNQMDQALLSAEIEDRLPVGLSFVEGSARRDGTSIDIEPALSSDGILTFDLTEVAPNSQTVITYAVRVGPTTGQGKKTNTAILRGQQAGTGLAFVSEEGRATIEVDDRGGVFSDEAVVLGRVFLDKNGDGIQTEFDDENNPHHEPSVPGVKIVTSTGLSVVTDSEGRYSLFGLRPVTHAFALQSSTLPKLARPMQVDVDDIGAPGSRLIDLKRGEIRAEHFPLTWTAEAEADVVERIKRFEGVDKDESFARDDLPLSFDAVTRNSSRGEAGLGTKTELLTEEVRREAPQENEDLNILKTNIEDLVKEMTADLAFVGIGDGYEATRPTLTTRIKGPVTGKLRLEVNGQSVPESQIGAKVIHQDGGVQVYEYVALKLKPNENKIAAIFTDPFGNDRGREEITVFAPGEASGLVLIAPEFAPANARARIPVTVRIVDDAGRLVRVPAEVTLSAENGTWDVRDIRDGTHGLQAYIDNGEAIFDFIPPDLVGGETITVTSDFEEAKTEIGFTPLDL